VLWPQQRLRSACQKRTQTAETQSCAAKREWRVPIFDRSENGDIAFRSMVPSVSDRKALGEKVSRRTAPVTTNVTEFMRGRTLTGIPQAQALSVHIQTNIQVAAGVVVEEAGRMSRDILRRKRANMLHEPLRSNLSNQRRRSRDNRCSSLPNSRALYGYRRPGADCPNDSRCSSCRTKPLL
jgi:hypothetical protein